MIECIPMNPPPQHWGCSCGEVLSVGLIKHKLYSLQSESQTCPSHLLYVHPEVRGQLEHLRSRQTFCVSLCGFCHNTLPREYLCGEKKNRKIFFFISVSQKTTVDVFNGAGFQHEPGYYLFGWGDIWSHRQCVAESVHNYLVKASQDVFFCFMVNTSLPV